MKTTCQAFRIFKIAAMNTKIHLLLGFAMLGLQFSCVEKYFPEIDSKYENVLVVDGMISNNPGPYYIKLSLASTVNEMEFLPLSGYNVKIVDDTGTTEQLSEISPGTYSTTPTGIQGIVGRSYQTRIVSPEGKTYQSEFEELKNPIGIDSVYAIFEAHANPDGVFPYEGYQFYLNTKMAESDSNFYMWRLERSFEYRSDFLISHVFNGTLRTVYDTDSLQTCWKTDKIGQLFTFKTTGLSEPVVTKFPLNYVTTETRELMERYSLLVKQFTITERAYTFWNDVKEQNSTQGSLYTKLPFQIRGNVFNTETPDETVFGAFLVAGITEKRIFVNRPAAIFRYGVCTLEDADYKNVGTIYRSNPKEWPLYLTTDMNGLRAFPNQDCIDCQLRGGTIVKPDFWTEY